MSRPIGSDCCDWTVSGGEAPDFIFTCDNCEQVCEVVE